MSDSIEKLAPALVKALGRMTDLTKTETATVKSKRTGSEYTYRYATHSSLLRLARPILAEVGLALTQWPTGVSGEVETMIVHESGEFIASTYGIPLPPGATEQDHGKAISFTRKYAARSALNVAADEDEEGQRKRERASAASRGQRKADAAPPAAPTTPPPDQAAIEAKAKRVERVELWEKSIAQAATEDELVFRYRRAYGEVHPFGETDLTRRIIAAKDARKASLGLAGDAVPTGGTSEAAP